LAAVADKAHADVAIERIISLGAFDKSRKIIKRDAHVEIPVVSLVSGFNIIRQEDPAYYRMHPDLSLALRSVLPEDCMMLLPRGWFILGEVIIVKINSKLKPFEGHIGKALLDYYPRCCTVLADEGISGPFREPVRRVISGSKTQTRHKENGVIFNLDATKVMFSQGNLKERIRMSRFGKGEFVVDMFAGIGYFTIPMAVYSRPRKIMAIELNPNAYNFLCQNIKQNRVEDIVMPVQGDCAKKTPVGCADRVIMGMVQVTDQYLDAGILALKAGGILHYHQTYPSWKYPDAAIQDIETAAAKLGRRAEIINSRRVKKYSPGVVHVVIDARIDRDF
jgi:tRNA wybutosine-synthesizing protein 2